MSEADDYSTDGHAVPEQLRGSIQEDVNVKPLRESDIAFGSPIDNPMACSDRLLDKAVDEDAMGGDERAN